MVNKSRTNSIYGTSVVQLAAMIREKEVSPVEVVDVFLERIERFNPKINAFCTVADHQARQKAKEAEKKVLQGEQLPPLHGIPIGIKDLTPTKGIRTTYGSKVFENNIPDHDAVFVQRVVDAGAIVLGKTNTPEFGYTGITDNLLFGSTSNPWHDQRIAGGSSGGSAAAVAAGLVPVAEGSDGGGSVRIPASACGVYGMKPTFGRIPFETGPSKFSANSPFLHHGTLTRNVEDAAYMLNVLQGPHAGDPYSLPAATKKFHPLAGIRLKKLKIAYSPDLDFYEVDHQVKRAMEQAVKQFEQLGCSVKEVSPGLQHGGELITQTFVNLWAVHFAAFFERFLSRWEEQLSPGFVATIKSGREIKAVDYKRLELARSKVYTKIEHIFSNYDLLITPTLAVPAFPHGAGPKQINGKKVNPYTDWMLTSVFNLTGHPAASINCGFSDDGLPIGLQIIAPRFREDMIFSVSKAFEVVNPDAVKVPGEFI